MTLVLSHLFLWFAIGATSLRHIVFQISKLDVHLGLMDHIIPSQGLGVLQLCKAYGEEREPPLLLECDVFERQYLMPWETGTYLYQPCVGYYMPIQHIFLLAISYTMLDVIKANPKLVLTLLVKRYPLNPLHVGAWEPCLLVLTLTFYKVSVLACITEHFLAELGGNLAMC
jgi:hypothetical protein